jgi:(p)ppGpp synthase/HD superfamily hydrolase
MNFTLSLKEDKACKTLFEKTYNIDHSGASLFSHLYNTFFILKKMSCEADVCLAGLYHAVYGTKNFKNNSLFEREEVKKIIGEKSESLVFYFSEIETSDLLFNNNLQISDEILYFLIKIQYANDLEQLRSIKGHEERFLMLEKK